MCTYICACVSDDANGFDQLMLVHVLAFVHFVGSAKGAKQGELLMHWVPGFCVVEKPWIQLDCLTV